MSTPDLRVAMKVKGCKDIKKIQQMLKTIYLQGLADGQDAEIDDTDRFLRIKLGSSYECECPECGAVLVLDLEDLLKRNGE